MMMTYDQRKTTEPIQWVPEEQSDCPCCDAAMPAPNPYAIADDDSGHVTGQHKVCAVCVAMSCSPAEQRCGCVQCLDEGVCCGDDSICFACVDDAKRGDR